MSVTAVPLVGLQYVLKAWLKFLTYSITDLNAQINFVFLCISTIGAINIIFCEKHPTINLYNIYEYEVHLMCIEIHLKCFLYPYTGNFSVLSSLFWGKHSVMNLNNMRQIQIILKIFEEIKISKDWWITKYIRIIFMYPCI